MQEAAAEAKAKRDNDEAMLTLAKDGDLGTMETFLAAGASPHTRDTKGLSVLHFAAAYDHVHVVRFLHSHGVDVDADDKQGRTALHMAALYGQERTLAFLLETGKAWVDPPDGNDETPLHVACRQGNDESVRVLLAHRPSLTARSKRGLTPLGEALVAQRLRAARMLLDAGADAGVDVGGYSLLHVCAGVGAHVSLVFLLGEGRLPPASADNPTRLTPVHCALLGGSFACLPPLLEAKGVDAAALNTEDADGHTPLDYVLEEGECAGHPDALEIVQVLRRHGGHGGSGVAAEPGGGEATQREGGVAAVGRGEVQQAGTSAIGGGAKARGAPIVSKSTDNAGAKKGSQGGQGGANKEDPDDATLRQWCRLSPQQLGELRLSEQVKKKVAEMEAHESYALMRRNARGLAGDERFVEMLHAPVVREALRRMREDREAVRAFQGHAGVMAIVARMGEALQRVRSEGLPVDLGLFIDMMYEEAAAGASSGMDKGGGNAQGSRGGGGSRSGETVGGGTLEKTAADDNAVARASDSPHGSGAMSHEAPADVAKEEDAVEDPWLTMYRRRPRQGWKKELGYALLRSLVPILFALVATLVWYPRLEARLPGAAGRLGSQAGDGDAAAAGSDRMNDGVNAGSEMLELGRSGVQDAFLDED